MRKICKKQGCQIKINKQGETYCGFHKVKIKKKNKYGAIKQTYRGKSYDSKLEARYAMELDSLKADGIVKHWQPQKTLLLEVNGKLICRYSLDFFVQFEDGREQLWEIKSSATKGYAWSIKWKLCLALFPEYRFEIYMGEKIRL